MYDSTTASDIPADGQLVAGYVDGKYRWRDQDWALFPHAVTVRIAVNPSTNDGHVLDVEDGAAYPTQAPAWVRMRRAAGVDPSVYVNLGNVAQVRAAFVASGDEQPHYWLAHYDNDPAIPPGYVAKQYANANLTGGHYDASAVLEFWPGVDVAVEYVTKADFAAYQADVRQTIEAMKVAYDPLVHHKHDVPGDPLETGEPRA